MKAALSVNDHVGELDSPLRVAEYFGVMLLVMWAVLIGNSLGWAQDSASIKSTSGSKVLEDFRHPDEKGFPKGWDAQRSTITAHETYQIQAEDGVFFLAAKGANQRVYTKQITWDPKTHPIIAGQRENTRAIKNTESSISRLEITVTKFVAEAGHTNREVASLRKDIHGEGGILDNIVDLKLKEKADSTRRQMIWIAISAVFSFTTAWFIATR